MASDLDILERSMVIHLLCIWDIREMQNNFQVRDGFTAFYTPGKLPLHRQVATALGQAKVVQVQPAWLLRIIFRLRHSLQKSSQELGNFLFQPKPAHLLVRPKMSMS